MDMLFAYVGIGVLGLVMGSFAGAQVWRLRARQLNADKKAGEKLTKAEEVELKRLKPLLDKSMSDDRSRCLHCAHELSAVDLVPLLSWLSTGGRCRYCRRFIGWFEPAIELGTAVLFLLSTIFWPWPLADPIMLPVFVFWLAAAVLFVILFVYDMKWFLLPDVVMWPLAVVGAIFAFLKVGTAPDVFDSVISLFGAIVLLSGLYAGIYYYSLWKSRGKSTWVGFGDVKLGLVLALFLADWQLAFLTLFLANFIGSLIAIPGLLLKLLPRGAHIPFGPLLIAGFFISFFWGEYIVDWFNMLVLY